VPPEPPPHAETAARPIRVPAAAIVFAILLSFVVATARYTGLVATVGPAGLVDFDSFYLAARLAVARDMNTAYDFVAFAKLQRFADATTASYMPWAYPPQYDLLVAPLALMPRALAYVTFIGATLAAFLSTIRRLGGGHFSAILMLVYVPVLVNLSTGQNGFLTASLMGVACLPLLGRSGWAGVPLGLMIVKPHLAVAVAIWVVVDRQWRIVASAAASVAATSLIATAAFGTGVWPAFLGGARAAAAFMAQGSYPFHRMVSVYAAVRSAGGSLPLAGTLQGVVAALALVAVVAAHRRFDRRTSLGIAIAATLLISPYAYDYDLPILGVALALLWPQLRAGTTRVERVALTGLCVAGGSFGFVQSLATPVAGQSLLTLAGPCLAVAAAWGYRVLARGSSPLPANRLTRNERGLPAG